MGFIRAYARTQLASLGHENSAKRTVAGVALKPLMPPAQPCAHSNQLFILITLSLFFSDLGRKALPKGTDPKIAKQINLRIKRENRPKTNVKSMKI